MSAPPLVDPATATATGPVADGLAARAASRSPALIDVDIDLPPVP